MIDSPNDVEIIMGLHKSHVSVKLNEIIYLSNFVQDNAAQSPSLVHSPTETSRKIYTMYIHWETQNSTKLVTQSPTLALDPPPG